MAPLIISLGPCLWAWPASVWGSCYLWNVFGSHTCCMCTCCFPLGPEHMGWPCVHTGSSPGDSSCLVVAAGSIGVLQCVTNMAVAIFPQLPFTTLFWTLFMAHLGYLYLTSASLRCCNSSFKRPDVAQTDLALWASVPMTLYLADRLWWLSHCKYWSVWVGLQYKLMLRELSASGLTKVSRKGIAPFSRLPSTVNFIFGSILLIWSKKSCLWACCWMTQVSSTNLYQYLGGARQTWVLLPQNIPCTGYLLLGLLVTPWLWLSAVHKTCSERRSRYYADRNPRG